MPRNKLTLRLAVLKGPSSEVFQSNVGYIRPHNGYTRPESNILVFGRSWAGLGRFWAGLGWVWVGFRPVLGRADIISGCHGQSGQLLGP